MSRQTFANQKALKKSEIELGSELAPKFNDEGLIPCITVDHISNEVLMFAWMDRQALELTLSTRKATYYSRSRQKIWVKGESSGLEQRVEQILVDCDQDVVQLRVSVKGEGTCHNGYRSCFYRAVKMDDPASLEFTINSQSFSPEKVYKK